MKASGKPLCHSWEESHNVNAIRGSLSCADFRGRPSWYEFYLQIEGHDLEHGIGDVLAMGIRHIISFCCGNKILEMVLL